MTDKLKFGTVQFTTIKRGWITQNNFFLNVYIKIIVSQAGKTVLRMKIVMLKPPTVAMLSIYGESAAIY